MSQIEKGKRVAIHYTLRDQEGQVLDSSPEDKPLEYVHGEGQIIPGLERALEGKEAGEAVAVTVPPGEAYGDRDDQLTQQVPLKLFEGVESVEPGMRFQAQTPSGTQVITVVAVEGDQVTVDANHPLAGETLSFDVTVQRVDEGGSGSEEE